MAPSAQLWRPPHHGVSSTASQARENDQTNVAALSSHNDQFKPFNIPNPRKKLQNKNSTHQVHPWISQADNPKQRVLRGQTRLLHRYTSTTFINHNNSLNLEPNEWQNRRINVRPSVGILSQNFAEKMNWIAPNLNCFKTRNEKWAAWYGHSNRSNKTIQHWSFSDSTIYRNSSVVTIKNILYYFVYQNYVYYNV